MGFRGRGDPDDDVGRIAAEYAGGLIVWRPGIALRAVLSGRIKREAKLHTLARPAVGDWVRFERSANTLAIVSLLPRSSELVRRAAGSDHKEQLIAANVDTAFIVNALDAPLRVRRLERFCLLAREGHVKPVVLLSKADVGADVANVQKEIARVLPDVPTFAVSARTGDGMEALESFFEGHQTIALMGLSGAGKSTLVNRWMGEERLATYDVRRDSKGRHTTTSRTLHERPGGGLLLDMPGVREVGLWMSEGDLDDQFDDVHTFALQCRFSDCRHETEPGCAVIDALAQGTLDRERWTVYLNFRNEARRRGGNIPSRRTTKTRAR